MTDQALPKSGFSIVLDALRNIPNNPVLSREMKERSSSGLALFAVTFWLFLLAGMVSLIYMVSTLGGANPVVNDSASLGQTIFGVTLLVMIALVLFLVPTFTASAIAGERGRQTLVPLQLTTMGPFAMVLGKTLAAVAFTALLVVSAAPILAVAVFLGGVSFGNLMQGIGMLLLTAVMLGTVGIMCSAVASKVQGAIVATYGFVLLITIGSIILFTVIAALLAAQNEFGRNNDFSDPALPPAQIFAVNPFVGVASAVADSRGQGSDGPLEGIAGAMDELERERHRDAFGNPPAGGIEVTAPWRWYVVFCALTIFTSLWVATGRMRAPVVSER